MSDVLSNYGTLLKVLLSPGNYVSVGEVTVLEFPELINEPIEVTNHSSGSFREYIAGSLKEVASFNATLNYLTTVSGLVNAWTNSTKQAYEIDFNNAVKWQFNGYVTNIKAESADAASPEATQITVTFRPTDSLVIA